MVAAALGCVAAPAHAYNFTLGTDGETAESTQLANAIRERVRIPVAGLDQDDNGSDDRIEAEIIRPSDSGPLNQVPVIIDPSPYYTTLCRGNEGECLADTNNDAINDHWPLFLDNYFVPRGYAVMYLQADGTGNSEGCPLHGGPGDIAAVKAVIDWLQGRVDGYDGLGYKSTSDWDNGKAGMIGKSYDGTLINGVAATGVQGLTTVVPESAISDWYLYSRQGGIRNSGGSHYPAYLSNAVTNADHQAACAATRTDMNNNDADASGDRNAWWDARDYLPNVGNVRASVFETHGLQDDNVTTDQFAPWWQGLAAHDVPRKLWLLREGHVDPFDSRRAAWVDTLHRWFDYWLDGVQNGIMSEPRVDIEESKDDWHTYSDWPLPGTADEDVYLQGTDASTAGAVGLSSGGNVDSVAFTDSSVQSERQMMTSPTGAQTSKRVFLSNVLAHDLRISGTPRIALKASLSTTQSNLGVLLVDYSSTPFAVIHGGSEGISNTSTKTCWGQDPPAAWGDHSSCYYEVNKVTQNVTQFRVARGVLDSSNRLSLYTPTLVTANQPTDFSWSLMPDDYTFKAGHQIGVIVVGDYRDISLNGTSGATITIDTRASRIVLPVVGGHAAAAHSGAFTDTIAPALTVPADIAVDPTDADGAVVTYPDPGVTDNLDPAPTASCTPASGSLFPQGTTTVTCTAQDANGNTTTDSFKVTVGTFVPPTPPQQDIPAPPAPTGGGGDVPVPPTPAGNQPPTGGGGKQPTLDTVDKLAPRFAALAFTSGRHSLKARFKLDEAATVTMTVYRHGSKKALRTTRKRLRKGKDSLTVKSSKLKKGTYTVKLTAVDAAGNARHLSKVVRIRR